MHVSDRDRADEPAASATDATTPVAFDVDTAVLRHDADHFTGQVARGYGVVDGAPNGGYVTAIAARALQDRLGAPHPVTVTTHFLRPAVEAAVEIRTEAMKDTGRHRTGAARMLQDGVEVLRITGTFTDLGRADGPSWTDVEPAEVPPPADCIRLGDQEKAPPIFGRTDLRLTPASLGWAVGQRSGRPDVRGWTGVVGRDHVTPLDLLFLCDAIPPPVFNLDLDVAWVPTIELTTQVRGIPAPGPCRVHFFTHFLTDGYLETEGRVWDADNRLVALTRQLALAPRPRG